jgi:uncharacterized protein
MKRDISKKLINWASSNKRKPLIITGARQIGKSWVIRHLGLSHFKKNYCEINFEKLPQLAEIFEQDLDVKRIISELEVRLNQEILPTTLLFFDEIQSCPKAIMSLRYFYEEMPELAVIAAGSLLEFQLKNIPFPVGRVQLMQMYPMTFQEFLVANDKTILLSKLKESPSVLATSIEQLLYRELQNYFWVGGMPFCVQHFIENQNYYAIRNLQKDLMETYVKDFSKYNPLVNKDCLLDILKEIPKNVGNQITYTKLSEQNTGPTIKKGIEVLRMANIIQKVNNVSISSLPFTSSDKKFKLVFLDIGLLLSMANVSFETLFNNKNLNPVFNGSWAEQFVAQQLMASNNTLHYWARTNSNSNAEVDYVIEQNGQIIPIEVKSGAAGKLRSLHVLFAEHPHITKAIIYSKAPLGVIDKMNFTPIYYAGIE